MNIFIGSLWAFCKKLVFPFLGLVIFFSSIEAHAISFQGNPSDSDSSLISRGNYFFSISRYDSAIFYYSYVYRKNEYSKDVSELEMCCRALNGAFKVYFFSCDYQKAFQAIQKAMLIAEDIRFEDYLGNIYNNVGNILMVCMEHEDAVSYWNRALSSSNDDKIKSSVLNNLGVASLEKKDYAMALTYFLKSYDYLKRSGDSVLCDAYNNLGYTYYELEFYDSAYHYLEMAYGNASQLGRVEKIPKILINQSKILFARGEVDSAFLYLHRSMRLSEKEGFFDRLAEAYYYSAAFYDSLGNVSLAYKDFQLYAQIKDSILTIDKGLANQLLSTQKLNRVEKRVGELLEDQAIVRMKMRNKTMVSSFVSVILLLSVIFIFLLVRENRKLNRSYHELVQKNQAIIRSNSMKQQYRQYYERVLEEKDRQIHTLHELVDEDVKRIQQDSSTGGLDLATEVEMEQGRKDKRKYVGSFLKGEKKASLILQIEKIMENPDIFCNPEFSLEKLAELAGSNSNYVSQIVNEVFQKNFQTYLNEHRIQEVCRLLAKAENRKYSIETIASMAGFKSKSSFNQAFKRITGVTPSIYLKNMTSSVL